MSRTSNFACPLIAFAAALVAGSVRAEDATTVVGPVSRVEHVRFDAAELTSEAGIRSLRSRVRHASHRVCAPGDDTYMASYSELRCFSPTVKDAFGQVDRAIAQNGGRGDSLAGVASISVRAR